MTKKAFSFAVLTTLFLSLAGCGPKGPAIAVPNDTTNEARALLLLQAEGIIKLREGAGITAVVRDIVENPKGVVIREVEAAQIPNVRRDVDFAVINSNFAIAAGLNPVKNALVVEGAYSAYANIVAVKAGAEAQPKIKALVAALKSKKVADFITAKYNGAVVSTVTAPGDGTDATVDYAALQGQTVKVAASPTPHAEILAVVKSVLAEKGVKLEIAEFSDYVQPNLVVEQDDFDANYFQHLPYLEDFNREKGTHLVSVAAIHVEPIGLYPGKSSDLSALK